MNNKLMKMMPMASCKEASRLMSAGMNRRLSLLETLGLKMHLLMCGTCRQVLKQMKGLRLLLRTYREYIAFKKISSPRLSQIAKDRLQRNLSS